MGQTWRKRGTTFLDGTAGIQAPQGGRGTIRNQENIPEGGFIMSLLTRLQQLLGLSDETPPRPAGWNKTLDDLTAENRSLSGHEIEWAREYQREQLRSWARFPNDGERFEAVTETEVTYQIDWRGPYGTGGKGMLPAGSVIRVAIPEGSVEPVGVYADPVDEKAVELLLIPENDRNSTSYNGFSLFLGVDQLNKDFRLLDAD
jgi:hypothetical protein